MNFKIIFLLILFHNSFQSQMNCLHVFEKEYIIFLLREDTSWTKIEKGSLININSDSEVLFIGCSEFDIPRECTQIGKAIFVYMKKGSPCVVVRKADEIIYQNIDTPNNQDNYKIKMNIIGEADSDQEKKDKINLNIEVSYDPIAKSGFSVSENTFFLEIVAKSNPIHVLKFLRVLKDNAVISSIIFFTFGFILCFLGLKFYKDMLLFFIPLMLVVLAFYLYVTIVEKSVEQNEKVYLIIITLFCIGAFIALAVTFTNVIYIVLSLVASYQFGTLLHKILEPKIPFFTNPHTEYITIGLVFVGMVYLYFKMKDYFIICCTSLIGSFLMILGCSYASITDTDFLFSIESSQFKNFDSLDPQIMQFLTIYCMILLLGILVQIYLHKKDSEKVVKKGDLCIQLAGV